MHIGERLRLLLLVLLYAPPPTPLRLPDKGMEYILPMLKKEIGGSKYESDKDHYVGVVFVRRVRLTS